MTPAEVKRCRQTLGLSQRGLARLLRLSEDNGDRIIRRWEAGEVEITGPASLVLDMLCNDVDPVGEMKDARIRYWIVHGTTDPAETPFLSRLKPLG